MSAFPDLNARVKKDLKEALTSAMNDADVWSIVDSELDSLLQETDCHLHFSRDGAYAIIGIGKGDAAAEVPIQIAGLADYTVLKSTSQAEDIEGRIAGIEKFEAMLKDAKARYASLLNQYKSPAGFPAG